MNRIIEFLLTSFLLSAAASAAPAAYEIDPTHTFPSFEADHMGISIWRGKFDRTTGRVTLDKAAGTGTVDLTIDLSSVDFGLADLNLWAQGPQFFDVRKHPQANYKGTLDDFSNGIPRRLTGELRLNGVTHPVVLTINSFKCIPHPMLKREFCGADASGVFHRDDFGLDAGKDYGFNMDVTLRIQVEAIAVSTG